MLLALLAALLHHHTAEAAQLANCSDYPRINTIEISRTQVYSGTVSLRSVMALSVLRLSVGHEAANLPGMGVHSSIEGKFLLLRIEDAKGQSDSDCDSHRFSELSVANQKAWL